MTTNQNSTFAPEFTFPLKTEGDRPADGRPAFPLSDSGFDMRGTTHEGVNGMTLRAYAAIKLRVPNSGIDWLDDMIRASMRDEFAAKAMQGLVARKFTANETGQVFVEWVTEVSFEFADQMLSVREA